MNQSGGLAEAYYKSANIAELGFAALHSHFAIKAAGPLLTQDR